MTTSHAAGFLILMSGLLAVPAAAQHPDLLTIPVQATLRGEFRTPDPDRPARLRGSVIRTSIDTLWLRRNARSTIAIPRGTILQLDLLTPVESRGRTILTWTGSGLLAGALIAQMADGLCTDEVGWGQLECMMAGAAGASLAGVVALVRTRPRWVRYYPATE